ncbi:MAG: methionine--tRNA ligase subunit beta, partial [Simkania sp.]|nr:methionine--tRNA ligase subunit beta [Simkania sp.]
DNIPFHAIFFPAMTMGQDEPYKTVDELPANEFYNLEGKQFSKSAGWYIDLEEFFKHFSADQIRYAIAANAPETQDSEFSWKDFQMRCNSELLGKYGNLINRVLVFTQNKCEGVMPPYGDLKHEDEVFLEKIHELTQAIYEAYSHFHLRKATQLIMELAQEGNVYFDTKKPWKDPEGLNTTIACCLRALNALALVSFPIIPDTAEKVWKLLGNDTNLKDQRWEAVLERGLPVNRTFPKPEVLFSKVEDHVIEKQLEDLKEATGNLKDQISFDAFQKLDIRVAEILSAEEVPKSDKLYKIEVNLGFEKRVVVSGIRKAYPDPKALLGKKIAFIANLKPAKLMGIQSQGMILAAGNDDSLEVVEIQGAPLGSPIA